MYFQNRVWKITGNYKTFCIFSISNSPFSMKIISNFLAFRFLKFKILTSKAFTMFLYTSNSLLCFYYNIKVKSVLAAASFAAAKFLFPSSESRKYLFSMISEARWWFWLHFLHQSKPYEKTRLKLAWQSKAILEQVKPKNFLSITSISLLFKNVAWVPTFKSPHLKCGRKTG